MKFSAQEEYGLRCLMQIAQAKEGSLTIPEISQFEGLSSTHVAKLLAILRKEGFINSTRGQAGGYALAMPPEKINIGEVLSALGGRLLDDSFCERHSGQLSTCTHAVNCSVKSLWTNIQIAVDQVVQRVTLADLIAAGKEPETLQLTIKPRAGAKV